MKLSNKILIALILSLFIALPGYSQNCKSSLNIITDLNNSVIYINGRPAGIGKTEVELAKGTYVVQACEPDSFWNPRILTDTVRISDCNKLQIVRLSFSSYRYLNTSPPDVSVSVRDSVIGYTPLFIKSNVKQFELNKKGYGEIKITPEHLPYNKKIYLNFTGTPPGKRFFQKDIFKYLLGGIVVLGGATAYFKLKADNRFSEYQATGHQNKLDQTKKYDFISGLTLAGLEINFGVLLYYFLSD